MKTDEQGIDVPALPVESMKQLNMQWCVSIEIDWVCDVCPRSSCANG